MGLRLRHWTAGGMALLMAGMAAPGAAAAGGDPRPPLSEVISFSALNEFVTRISLLLLRSNVDFTYADVSNDPYANTTSITGLTFWPELPWDTRGNCVIRAERLVISSAELGQWDRIGTRIEMSGATAPLDCLPPEVAFTAATAEVGELVFDRAFLTFDYRFNTSALTASLHLTMPGIATVTADADFAYVAIRDEDSEPVVAELSHAAVAVEDLGLWEKARRIMPPAMTEPDAFAAMIEGGLTEMFADMNPLTAQGAPPRLTPEQAQFVQAAAARAKAFAEKPDAIVVETGMSEGVWLSGEIMDDPALFAALQPTVSSRPAARSVILPAALLSAALSDPASLSDAERLQAGKALISGQGAPRSPADGLALLQPLADRGDTAAALVLSDALTETDPETAYRYAIRAGAAGAADAPGVLDRLEQNLTTPAVLEMQAAALADSAPMPSPHDFVPLAEARARALAHLRGRGAVRSYARAYYWALLGQAAQDGASASLAAEIEARMRHRGEAAAAAWDAAAGQARADVLAHWLTADYPARLKGE